MDDYELSETPCPKCGHEPTHYRDCGNFNCEDGYIDASHDDAINYSPGEEYDLCYECWGTGFQAWCPNCGADLSKIRYVKEFQQAVAAGN